MVRKEIYWRFSKNFRQSFYEKHKVEEILFQELVDNTNIFYF